MIKSFMTLIIISFMGGCGSIKTVCPQYPKPSQKVLNKIKSLNDVDVDAWIVKQYKLNKQLRVCNEL